MATTAPIADEQFDLAGTSKTLRVRLYAPTLFERTTYATRVRMGPPFDRDRPTYGEGSLQALALGVSVVTANLYSCDLWKRGQLGWRGTFGGYLGLAAPTTYLDFAPYPFDLREGDDEAVRDAAEPDASDEPIVEEMFAVFDPVHPVGVRIFRPEKDAGGGWRCRVQIDSPVDIDRYALGAGPFEALWRALCVVGRGLYAHPLWRAGKLGRPEGPGSYLGVAAPTSLTYLAPHPF